MKKLSIVLLVVAGLSATAQAERMAPDLVLRQLAESLNSQDYLQITDFHLAERIEKAYADAITQVRYGTAIYGLSEDELARKRENAQRYVPLLRELIKSSSRIREIRRAPTSLPQRDQSMPDFD
jgi:alanine racemase